jgi:hypothetical protein
LAEVPVEAETEHLRALGERVGEVVLKARPAAEDLAQAQESLRELAQCLRYPKVLKESEAQSLCPAQRVEPPVSVAAVRADVEAWLRQFQSDLRGKPAQAAVACAGRRLWKAWGPDMLPCYEIGGLPQDNLALEALFGELRGQERRISGRKSTHPLREFGQCRVLLDAKSRQSLLEQMRRVPVSVYRAHRERLAAAEVPRQQRYRMHRDPGKAMSRLLAEHKARRETLASVTTTENIHTS